MTKNKNFSVKADTQNFKAHKPTDNPPKRKSNAGKAPASDVFSGVLENKEKKSRRMQLLLTDANFEILVEASKKTGRSKNDIINRLIATLGENTYL